MDETVTNPTTGQTYSLRHLKPFQVVYRIKVDRHPIDVALRVHFSNHCYTRSRKNGDTDNAVLYQETKRGGLIDERIFCASRWEFSKSLPSSIIALHSKGCFSGSNKAIFYRQEQPLHIGSYHGWYICARLSASERHQNLTMSVRSAHWRTNRPFNVRGGTKRFYTLLAQFYAIEKKKRNWL